MPRSTLAVCLLLLAGPALAVDPCADPRCPDAGFGVNGQVAIDFAYGDADRGNAVVRVPGEDRLYVIGQVSTLIVGDADFGVVCLLEDGSPCPDFGSSGTATVAMDFTSGGLDAAIAGAVLPWGPDHGWRLVVVGQVERDSVGDTDFGVALLRPDGTLETTASGGKVPVYFDLGADYTDLPAAVAVTAYGKVLIGGTVDVAAGDSDWGFARLNYDLTLDTTFGTNGKAVLDVAGLAVMHAMLLQPDGKIVAVGSRDFGDDQMVIARLNADGSPDVYFGFLGQTVFGFDAPWSTHAAAWAVASDPQARLLMVGQADLGPQTCSTAARVLPDGAPDTTFQFGSATSASCLSQAEYAARAVAVFPDGHFASAHESSQFGDFDFVIHDQNLAGDEGTFYYPFDLGGSNDDRPRGMLIQPDGKIVVAGRVVGSGGTLDFGVLRVWSHQVFADGFEAWGGSFAEWDLLVTSP